MQLISTIHLALVFSVLTSTFHSEVSFSILVAWELPPNPFFKLNFDGSVHGTCVVAGIIIRDFDGHLLKAATLNLVSSLESVAETPPFSKACTSLSKITFAAST